MKRHVILVLLVASLAACGAPPTATPDAIATQVAQVQAVASTLTAAVEQSWTPTPTKTLTPTATDTPTATPTPTVTDTPSPTLSPTPRPTTTATHTPSPAPTWTQTPVPTKKPASTPAPTAKPKELPGIGQPVRCGNMYEIVALSELDLSPLVTSDPAKGRYGKVRFRITNLQSRTNSLSIFGDELLLRGMVAGRWLEFEPTLYGPSMNEEDQGWASWSDDLPPGIPVKAMVIFDVNPAATDWTLVVAPEEGFKTVCRVEVHLRQPGVASNPAEGTATVNLPLLADSQGDFSGGQGQNGWEYLFSEGRDTFNWKPMGFDGSCWRAPLSEPDMRICPDHGAPGKGGDLAWLYKAESSGKLVFQVSAKKSQAVGDDIKIRVYRHTNLLQTWVLGQGDTYGVSQQLELDANGGEMFFFTMQVSSTNREFKYDPTHFRVRVFQK